MCCVSWRIMCAYDRMLARKLAGKRTTNNGVAAAAAAASRENAPFFPALNGSSMASVCVDEIVEQEPADYFSFSFLFYCVFMCLWFDFIHSSFLTSCSWHCFFVGVVKFCKKQLCVQLIVSVNPNLILRKKICWFKRLSRPKLTWLKSCIKLSATRWMWTNERSLKRSPRNSRNWFKIVAKLFLAGFYQLKKYLCDSWFPENKKSDLKWGI